jgi:hypothetical protein
MDLHFTAFAGTFVMTRQNEEKSVSTDVYSAVGNSSAPCKSNEELLYSKDSLIAFKNNQAWPGRDYSLVGEAHTIERRFIDTISATRRAACISYLLHQRGRSNQQCVNLKEALSVPGFVSCLTRVEYAWLKKQPPSTLIGPSFTSDGTLIAESFALWVRNDVCKASVRNHNSFRSFRTSRSTSSSRHEV